MFEHKFTLANGPSTIISWIFKQKFDELNSSWKKVRIELRDRWFGEFKAS